MTNASPSAPTPTSGGRATPAPWLASRPAESGYERRWWILGVLVLSLVIVMTANTSLNIAIPSLVSATGASSTSLQWIVDAYALVFAGVVLSAGALGDRFGRKGALLCGLAIFGAMSLLATLADDPGALIAIRAVQGLGAALIMPGTLSILAATFPPAERSRAIAIWVGFAGSGAAIGIVGSGWLLEHYWWGSVFFVNVPIVTLAVVLVAVIVPTSRDPRILPLDVTGALLSIVTLGALLFGIIEGPERGWADPLTIAGFVTAAAGLGLFLAWERRSEFPMLDVRFFTNPGFTIGTATIALTFFAMFGMFFLLTQYLQSVRGYSPLEAGVRTLPMMLTMVPAASASARWAERFGSRAVLSTGLTLVAAGMGVLATLGTDTPYWRVALGLAVLGVGMGNVAAPATGAVMTSLPMAKAGVGSAVNDTAREVGGALGIAVMGSIVASGFANGLDPAVARLSPADADLARSSVGAALQVAARLGGDVGTSLDGAARATYTDAMATALAISAVVALVTVGLVQRFLPRHHTDTADRNPPPEDSSETPDPPAPVGHQPATSGAGRQEE